MAQRGLAEPFWFSQTTSDSPLLLPLQRWFVQLYPQLSSLTSRSAFKIEQIQNTKQTMLNLHDIL